MTVSVNLPIAISCATRGGCASSLKKRRVSPPLHPAAVSVRRLLRSRIQHRAQRPLAGVSETTKGGGMAKLMEDTLKGTGTLRRGTRTIGPVAYTIQLDPLRGHATVVQFDKKPAASGGDLVHLTLEDGRVLSCLMFDHSRCGAIVGEGRPTAARGADARRIKGRGRAA